MRLTLAFLAASAALSLSACSDYAGGGPRSWGPDYAYSYDGWYDGYYGPFYDGYWGNDGGFWYRPDAGGQYRRGDGAHFRRGAATTAPAPNFNHFQGRISAPPAGIAMPHFHRGR